MTHSHAACIEAFYEAFSRFDAEGMSRCYTDDVRFSDPVFPDLRGEAARDMWRMLCARGGDVGLRVEVSGVFADAAAGRAHWEAWYTFSVTGRAVHNRIDATFTFRDGRIATHRDAFDLWRWTGMALGPVGRLFGWAPPLQNTLRRRAGADLTKFSRRRADASHVGDGPANSR